VTNQGQGTHTALSQIIADELDVPLDQIAVLSGDTAVVPYGGGTWASRGMPIGGSATMLAARALGEKIRAIAAGLLEAHAGDIELRQGRAEVRGSPGRFVSFGDLARTAYFRSNELRDLEPMRPDRQSRARGGSDRGRYRPGSGRRPRRALR